MMSSSSLDTRSRILDSARRLLEERGYHGVGLEQIAKAAGVSRQAVYLHFGSKGNLLTELAHYIDATGELPKLLDWVAASKDGVTALERFADAMAGYDRQIRRIAMVFFDARHVDSDFAKAWNDRMEARRAGCRRIVEWLARDGTLAEGWTVPTATDAVWAVTAIQVADALADRGWSQDRYARYLKTVLRRTFTAPRGRRRA